VLFPTHLLAAAILGRTSRLSTPWLVAGAAVPDVVDKPLGLLGVVDLYHSVGHSVLVLGLLTPVAFAHRGFFIAAVGWGSHLALDALHVVINGRPTDALSLAWPVIAPPDPLGLPPVPFVVHYIGTLSFVLELGLWLFAGGLLFRDRRS
jgi:hypothetical protein